MSLPGDRVRLAELLAALSLDVDLGFGQPMEHVLRQCWIALRPGEHIGLAEQERSVVCYTSLLTNVAVIPTPMSRRSGSATTSR